MLPKPTFATLLVASLSTGCAVGPDCHRPDAPLLERFQGLHAVEHRDAAANATLPSGGWLRRSAADPLRENNKALAQNLDLAQASARAAWQAQAWRRKCCLRSNNVRNLGSQASRAYQPSKRPWAGLNLDARFQTAMAPFTKPPGASWELDVSGGLRRDTREALRLPSTRHRKREQRLMRLAVETAQTAGHLHQHYALQTRLAVAAAG